MGFADFSSLVVQNTIDDLSLYKMMAYLTLAKTTENALGTQVCPDGRVTIRVARRACSGSVEMYGLIHLAP